MEFFGIDGPFDTRWKMRGGNVYGSEQRGTLVSREIVFFKPGDLSAN
jgi:hypothetical protein